MIKIKEKLGIKIHQLYAPICSIYEDLKKDILERLVNLVDNRKKIRERDCIIEWVWFCKIVGIECIVIHPEGIKVIMNLMNVKRLKD